MAWNITHFSPESRNTAARAEYMPLGAADLCALSADEHRNQFTFSGWLDMLMGSR
jgi:hypothetical protein